MKIGKNNFIVQWQLHNEKALEFLTMEYGEYLLSIIKKHLFTLPHLQKACLIDTVMAIWKYAECFEGENEFENWAGSVARYRCLEFLRIHQKEATIAWLIEKEIAEEKEVMISCLSPAEQELFEEFYENENEKYLKETKKDASDYNIYDLLNRIDTDIAEYEKASMTAEEKEEIFLHLQTKLQQGRRRFSFRRYFESFYRKAAPVNC